jgi:hypothetical protein
MRMFVGLGMIGLAGVFYVGDQINLHANYTKVEGKIVSVEADCYIQAGRSKLVEKDSGTKAYMDCNEAKLAAEAFGYKPRDIHRRVKITYVYQSPVDKSQHKGKAERENVGEAAYQIGTTVSVYAHDEKAESSRI